MDDSHCPAISVILITPDRYQSLRKTIRHLRAQSVRDRMEIVVVTPAADSLELDERELQEFCGHCVVEVGPITSVGPAYAAGIRQASAPIVVLGEDHSFPQPGWAEALLRAHQQSWAVVGPVVRNANPGSRMSWADFLMGYAPWQEPTPAGEMDHLPGHNSSYKREILLRYGVQLDSMMEAESVLHWDLRRNGHRLYLEPAAITTHVNFTLLSSWIQAVFQSGRKFGAFRAGNERWSLARRLLFAAAAPLIPLVRFRRILAELRRPGRPSHRLPGVAPLLLLGLTVDGAGQMTGYALGAGAAREQLLCFEFHRYRHVRKRDRPTEAL
ncbi:MAG TPA: glycosyltransferase [Bryobacterales bacterium]|nr:glycosyltransferase [Bryobacterales bacterium]